ncbi:hypothetical protein VNI00_017045 [Paramarasmius palmivorus]|uniref:Uncharacterized protein n=1 Tax=Paramarasmius palmivorus TaxID=297713 RepID=A0AAW0B728_9AGAR
MAQVFLDTFFNEKDIAQKCAWDALETLACRFRDSVTKVVMPLLIPKLRSRDMSEQDNAVLALKSLAKGAADLVAPHTSYIFPFLIGRLENEAIAVGDTVYSWSHNAEFPEATHLPDIETLQCLDYTERKIIGDSESGMLSTGPAERHQLTESRGANVQFTALMLHPDETLRSESCLVLETLVRASKSTNTRDSISSKVAIAATHAGANFLLGNFCSLVVTLAEGNTLDRQWTSAILTGLLAHLLSDDKDFGNAIELQLVETATTVVCSSVASLAPFSYFISTYCMEVFIVPHDERLLTGALFLLTGLIQNLGAEARHSFSADRHHNTFESIHALFRHPQPKAVKATLYGLLGTLAKYDVPIYFLSEVLPLLHSELDTHPHRIIEESALLTNVLWCFANVVKYDLGG